MQYDFIAVGDTVVDDFIKLSDAEVRPGANDETKLICMRFGDKIPFEFNKVVYGVGNAANAAVSAARLGLKTAFVANTGNDENGKKILEHFAEEGVDTTYVTLQEGIPTNYHYVLWYGAERTILIKHQAYKYEFPKDMPPPKTLYFSSLGENTEPYHDAIADYIEAHPDMFVAFQPGTFQMKIGIERLSRIYKRAGMYVLNKEEAGRVLKHDNIEEVEVMAKKIRELGPKIVLITDGPNGVYALNDTEFFHMDMFPDPKPPLQRTGAGDAFASTTAAFLTMGMPLKDAMKRGTVNSAYVVQGIGAQQGLLKKDELEKILKEAA